MTNPLDELIKKYEEQLVLIQKQKAEAKNAYDIACKNEDRYQGAMPKVLDNVMPDVTGPSMPLPKK